MLTDIVFMQALLLKDGRFKSLKVSQTREELSNFSIKKKGFVKKGFF